MPTGKVRLGKMKCKHIQELLLTDYTDGEMGAELKNEVQDHLRTCIKCREFERDLRKAAIDPFHNTARIVPRDAVWERIREAVVSEEQSKTKSFPGKVQDFFQRIFSMPKAAYALASVITVMFITVMAIRFQPSDHKVVNVQTTEEIEYLTYLMEEAEYFSVDENGGYSTLIEEYFL